MISLAILIISFSILFTSIPQAIGKSSNNSTDLTYRTSFYFKNSTLNIKINPTIDLIINHSGYEFPGNGTIHYYFSQNITQFAIINALKMFFTPNIITYIQNHTSNQYFTTFYSGRTESVDQILNVSDNDFWTYFWIAADQNSLENIQKGSYIYFFNESNPNGLGCDGKFVIGTNNMDESHLNMWFSPTTTIAYRLSLDLSIGSTFFKIINYYDSNHGVLLRSDINFNTNNQLGDLQGDFSFLLIKSNLTLEKSFNYNFLILMFSFAAIVIIISLIAVKIIKSKKLSRINQKKNRLENL